MLFTKHFFFGQRKLLLCCVTRQWSIVNGKLHKLHVSTVKRGMKWNKNYVFQYTNEYFLTANTAAGTSAPSICLYYYPLFSYTRLANYPCKETVCLTVDRDDITEGTLPSAHCCTLHPSLAIQTISYPTKFTPTMGINGLNILILHYTYATKTFNCSNLL